MRLTGAWARENRGTEAGRGRVAVALRVLTPRLGPTLQVASEGMALSLTPRGGANVQTASFTP